MKQKFGVAFVINLSVVSMVLTDLPHIFGQIPSSGNPSSGGVRTSQQAIDQVNYQWQQQQSAIAQAKGEAEQEGQAETLANIDSLNGEIASNMQDAANAQMAVESLRKQFSDSKKLIPRDPWREIYGEKKYVMSAGSGFVKFSGQIQEITLKGIRIWGEYGDADNVEFFLINFPYHFGEGESIDPTKIYAALDDGKFSYITEDGYAKTLPKLNYGHPCVKPKNADSVEKAAQQLTPQEESQLNFAEFSAKEKTESAVAAQQRLQNFLDELEAAHTAAIQKIKAAQALALKNDQEQADKGDRIALRRMGERYRDGEGVQKDLAKADEYFKKADEATKAEWKRINEENKLEEQASRQQRFIRMLNLADRGDRESMVNAGKCYRDGDGVEKDLNKAREYFWKASNLASTEAAVFLNELDSE
jgi:TPR repeat protein